MRGIFKSRLSIVLAFAALALLPLRAGAEGDPNGEAPQTGRTVSLPLGSVDAVSGALTMKVPLGPRLPGRIPLGFSWSYNSQDSGHQAIGGCFRPVVWPGGSFSPLQLTVTVEGEPWVFYRQARPVSMPTTAQFIQWAQDRGVKMIINDPPTVTVYPSSDGTRFYVEYVCPTDIGGARVYRVILYQDSAIWTKGGSNDSSSIGITHFTSRWGDAVTVTESNWFNGWCGAPGKIVISNDNRTSQTLTLTVSGSVNTYIPPADHTGPWIPNRLAIPSATLTVDNTLAGNDGVKLPKVQVSGLVGGLERMGSPYAGESGLDTYIYDEGLQPSSITILPQDGGPGVTTSFAWATTSQMASATLPSGLTETFDISNVGGYFSSNRASYWKSDTGCWYGLTPPPPEYNPANPDSDVSWDLPQGVNQVSISGAGTGTCYVFVRLWPVVSSQLPYVSQAMPHITDVLTYPVATPGASDVFRGVRFIHPSSWVGMVGDSSAQAYLFATSVVLAEEKIHGSGLPSMAYFTWSSEPAFTIDQMTVYDGWTLKSWANPSGLLSTSSGLPVTAAALRSRTWTPAAGLLGPLPDRATIAGDADSAGPTTTDEYTDSACTAPPTVDGSTMGPWSDAITAPSYAMHRRGHITRTWDSGFMRLVIQTDHKTYDEVSGTNLRFTAPGSGAPPAAEAVSSDFGTTSYAYDPQGRITGQSGLRGSYTATESRTYGIVAATTTSSASPQPIPSGTTKSLTGPGGTVWANPANHAVTVGQTFTYSDPLVQSGPSTVTDKADGRTESFTYDALGRVVSHTDVRGVVTTTAYDAWGHAKSVIRQAKGGVASMTTTYAHDPGGLWKTETVVEGDSGRSLTVRTDMDALGRVVKVTGADGSTQTFGYTGYGEKSTASPVLKPGQTSWGNETWTYDAIGRETDHWDAQGRLLQHVAQQPAWTTISGLTGIWTTTQDDRNYTRSEGHDLAGQKLGIVDQAGNLTRYWYDQDGHLLETQQGSQYRAYTYNDMGWLTSRTEPEEGTTAYSSFTLLGTPLQTVQTGRSGGRNNTFTTTLDAHLQPAGITAAGPEGAVTRTLSYDYGTSNTHLLTGLSESQANGTLAESYGYDGLFRLVAKTVSDGTQAFSVSQTLDAAGRQLSLTYPNAAGRADQTVTGYDTLGRPVTVALNGETKPSGSMVYGQVADTSVTDTLTFGNNAWTTSKVDKGELTHVTHTAAAGVLEDDAVTWTAGGLMLSRGADSWSYDSLQRVASAHVLNPADGSFVDQGFSYDRYGNRTATATAYGGAVPANNEALTWTAGATSGNDLPATVTAASGALSTGALYDDLGRLSQVWTTPGQSSTLTTWVYDPSGRVVKENGTGYLLDSGGLRFRRAKADGSVTYTVYGFGREPLSVFTKAPAGSLAWSKTMVYGFGQLLREEDSVQGTTYNQSDQVGSPNFITGPGGLVVGRAKTLPFGEQVYQWGDQSIRRYTNHERDTDSNAIYMQAREYLAAYGKFAEVDPAYDQTKDDPESWNLYNYVTNNPVTHTDPDGRMPIALNNAQIDQSLSEARAWDDAGSGLPDDPIQQASGPSDVAHDTQAAASEQVKTIAGTGDAAPKGAPSVDKTAPKAGTKGDSNAQTTTQTFTFQATAAIHEDTVTGPGVTKDALGGPVIAQYAGDGANRGFDTSNNIDQGSARISLIFSVNLTLTNGSLTGISTSISPLSIANPSHEVSPEDRSGKNTLNASVTSSLNGARGASVSFSASASNSLAPGSSLAPIRINGDIHFSSTGAYEGMKGSTSGYPWIQVRGFTGGRAIDNVMVSPAIRAPLVGLWQTMQYQSGYWR